MLPTITRIHVKNIEFPLFSLYKLHDVIKYYEGVLYIGDQIVDDRNLPGDTLGQRRLLIPAEERYPLRFAVLDLAGILESSSPHYIDSKGKAFTYKKTKRENVISHRIEKVVHRELYSEVKLKGISRPIMVRRPPPSGIPWARVVYIGKYPWEIIGYSEEQEPIKKRMV